MSRIDLSALSEPLPYLLRAGDVRKSKFAYEAQCLAYLDRSVIETALGAVVGVDGWQLRLESFGTDGAVRASLGLFTGADWLWRDDVGYAESVYEPAKSAATDAFKRAAARWGVGAFLRELPRPWLPCKARLIKEGDGPRYPRFDAWACDPVDEMEQRIAARRRPGTDRITEAMRAHGVLMSDVARWILSAGARDLNGLSVAQRGQLEALIVSGHFVANAKGGANGAEAQG